MMNKDGRCTKCGHDVSSHYNSTEFIQIKHTVVEIPAQTLIDQYANGEKNIDKVIKGITAKIDEAYKEIQKNIEKAVAYSNILDKIALKPIGKTRLNYVQELITAENAKPLSDRSN